MSGSGRLETTLTALYPYGRWTLSDGLELWGVLGAGRGEARHRLDGGGTGQTGEPGETTETRETGDLSMGMGSAGLRVELPRVAGMDLAARADASLTRMEIGSGPDYVDNLDADSWRPIRRRARRNGACA